MNDPSALFICYYIIIIFSIWFGHPEPQTSPFHGVKNINSNNSSYCCKSCPKNPIFLKKLLKKKFRKKIFHQKKFKNQNWSIFDFSLIGRSVFELEAKTGNLRKQVELAHSGLACFEVNDLEYLFTPATIVWEASRSLRLMTHPWWLIRRRILEASETIVAGVNKYSKSLTPKQARPGPVQGLYWPGLNNCFFWNGESQICGESQVSGESQVINPDLHLYKGRFGTPAQFPFGSQKSNISRAPPG